MADKTLAQINNDGYWHNNVALVQMLGLCPLLAVSATTINGLGLGIATTLTLVLSSVIVSLIRNYVKPEVRIPVFVMIIASVVTAIELAMNAYFHELFLILGIFVPLIVTNCAILGRAEAFASKTTPDRAFVDALAKRIASFPAASINACKQAVYESIDKPIDEALKAEAYWLYQATSKTPAIKRFTIADEKGLEHDIENQRNWNDLVMQVQEIQ